MSRFDGVLRGSPGFFRVLRGSSGFFRVLFYGFSGFFSVLFCAFRGSSGSALREPRRTWGTPTNLKNPEEPNLDEPRRTPKNPAELISYCKVPK
jgi:hypothetical protein